MQKETTYEQIPITRFQLPRGLKETIFIDRPSDIVHLVYENVFSNGYRIELETLRNGENSLTITDPEEGDLAIKIFPNLAHINEHFDTMIRNFKPEKHADENE